MLLSRVPHADIRRPSLVAPDRVDMLEIRFRGRLINVLWTAEDGLSVAEVLDDSVFDHVDGISALSPAEAMEYVAFLLEASGIGDLDSEHPTRKVLDGAVAA